MRTAIAAAALLAVSAGAPRAQDVKRESFVPEILFFFSGTAPIQTFSPTTLRCNCSRLLALGALAAAHGTPIPRHPAAQPS